MYNYNACTTALQYNMHVYCSHTDVRCIHPTATSSTVSRMRFPPQPRSLTHAPVALLVFGTLNMHNMQLTSGRSTGA